MIVFFQDVSNFWLKHPEFLLMRQIILHHLQSNTDCQVLDQFNSVVQEDFMEFRNQEKIITLFLTIPNNDVKAKLGNSMNTLLAIYLKVYLISPYTKQGI